MTSILVKVILTPLFFLVLTPVGVMLRWSGVDLINRNVDKAQESYWQSVDQGKPASVKPGSDEHGSSKPR